MFKHKKTTLTPYMHLYEGIPGNMDNIIERTGWRSVRRTVSTFKLHCVSHTSRHQDVTWTVFMSYILCHSTWGSGKCVFWTCAPQQNLVSPRLYKMISHFPLRSSTSPSAVRSHRSHGNTWSSGSSGPAPVPPGPPSSACPSASLRTSTRLQCQSRLGNPVRTSRRSWTRTRRPRGTLARTQTRHVCRDRRESWAFCSLTCKLWPIVLQKKIVGETLNVLSNFVSKVHNEPLNSIFHFSFFFWWNQWVRRHLNIR